MKHLALTLLLAVTASWATAQERIIHYHADIIVKKDRSVDVTEVIKVKAEGNNIQRGIFRDIPTVMYNDRNRRVNYNLEVLSVKKNGETEPYNVSSIDNGIQIRIGDANVFLDPAEYTYTIRYNMEKQVRFFDTYDEIYWNVTGDLWQFSMDKATAKVILPEGAVILQHSAYTGEQGATGQDWEAKKLSDHEMMFETTTGLLPYNGLTVAIGFEKGLIPPPTAEELEAEAFNEIRGLVYGGIGIAILLLYLLWAWVRVGRDPAKGAIIPRFEPPSGYSPAACRYVLKMGFDNKSFAASIISMAVKGYLRIEQKDSKYILHKAANTTDMLSAGEKKVADKLLGNKASIIIKQTNHSTISSAINSLSTQLSKDFKKLNFAKNYGWMVPAILIAIATVIMVIGAIAHDPDMLVPLVVATVFLAFFVPITITLINNFRRAQGWRKLLAFITMIIPLTFFVGIPSAVLTISGWLTKEVFMSYGPYVGIFAAIILIIVLFFYLIQAPTTQGRKVMDEIEGLKMFMEVAEKHRLNMLNAPEKTPELFEKLLPFAIALGVENKWGKQFEAIIAKAIENNSYQPTWYVGTGSFLHVGRFSSDLGSSLSSSISSASISPSSSGSSGSSGGGFSGGGGGGGGGGGW